MLLVVVMMACPGAGAGAGVGVGVGAVAVAGAVAAPGEEGVMIGKGCFCLVVVFFFFFLCRTPNSPTIRSKSFDLVPSSWLHRTYSSIITESPIARCSSQKIQRANPSGRSELARVGGAVFLWEVVRTGTMHILARAIKAQS